MFRTVSRLGVPKELRHMEGHGLGSSHLQSATLSPFAAAAAAVLAGMPQQSPPQLISLSLHSRFTI